VFSHANNRVLRQVRIDERDPSLNPLYGAGIHVFPGAPLARLELRVLMEELLSSTKLEPAVRRQPTLAIYPASGFASRPLRLQKR
jgi:cytochrome P450